MHDGIAFGLRVSADIALSTLYPAEDEGAVDVLVRNESLPGFPDVESRHYIIRGFSAGRIRMAVSGIGRFQISGGDEVLYEPDATIDTATAIPPMLPMCLAVILHQRGIMTLHASAVRIGDRVVAFVAHKGMGKSTTCANLSRRGHPVVTDDILAIDFNPDGAPQAIPSFPSIKMRPDAVPSIGLSPDDLPRLDPRFERRKLDASGSFSSDPAPLTHIYFLGSGPEVALEPLGGVEAFLQLLEHSYIVRLLGRDAAGPEHFDDCKKLASHVLMRRAVSPRGLEHLPALLDMIEDDVCGRPHEPATMPASLG